MTTAEDVLVPVTGIVDMTDRHGFIRTSGYLPGPDDVFVSMAQLKQYGLRRGDVVTGAFREAEARQGSTRRDRHNPLVRLDTVNGADPHEARRRPEFHTLTPLYPQERLRLETDPQLLTTRVIELVMPLGKGQRALIVSPPKAGKTMVQAGNDVVVLLDSITRLGRAYNNASPVSGRILAGGIDAAALYPPKRFLGAARNIEDGGSLTIIATAMVETGSTGDTVLFEEYKSTGNAELKLDRRTAEKRVFPAVDIEPSGTRKEELLLAPDELAVIRGLRKALQTQGGAAIEQLLDGLRKTTSNAEFLLQISRYIS